MPVGDWQLLGLTLGDGALRMFAVERKPLERMRLLDQRRNDLNFNPVMFPGHG